MTCPLLEYRESAGDQSFDVARAYCTAAETFVQPMRADICNDRYALDHAADCEIYLAQVDEPGADPTTDGTAPQTGDDANAEDPDA